MSDDFKVLRFTPPSPTATPLVPKPRRTVVSAEFESYGDTYKDLKKKLLDLACAFFEDVEFEMRYDIQPNLNKHQDGVGRKITVYQGDYVGTLTCTVYTDSSY